MLVVSGLFFRASALAIHLVVAAFRATRNRADLRSDRWSLSIRRTDLAAGTHGSGSSVAANARNDRSIDREARPARWAAELKLHGLPTRVRIIVNEVFVSILYYVCLRKNTNGKYHVFILLSGGSCLYWLGYTARLFTRRIYRRSDVGRGGRKYDGEEAEEVVEGWWNDDGSGVPGGSKKRGSLGRERRWGGHRVTFCWVTYVEGDG